MVSLHTVSDEIRAFFKWGGILIAVLLVLFLLFRFALFVNSIISPAQDPNFASEGKLPPIQFPSPITDNQLTYTIDTTSGELPTLASQILVPKINQPSPNLLAPIRAQEKVERLGFTSERIPLNDVTYQWNRATPPFPELQMNVLSLNFKLTSDYLADPIVLSAANLPSEKSSIEVASSFLSSLDALPSDLDTNKTKTTLYSISNNELVPASSFSSAQIVRVNFYQEDFNGVPVYYSDSPFSTMSFYVGSGSQNGQVVQAEFFHQNIASGSAVYPLKTAEDALNELKEGKGYISSNLGGNENILIKDVVLGYYLGNTQQQFLMPVIVFIGNNDFYGLVSAIKEDWISN